MTDQRLTDEEREQAADAVRDALEKVSVFEYTDPYKLAVELRIRGWRWDAGDDAGRLHGVRMALEAVKNCHPKAGYEYDDCVAAIEALLPGGGS